MSNMQLPILVNKDLRPQEVVQGLDVCMAQPRSNVGSICKTAKKGIVVRSQKKKKGGFNFQAKEIKLEG